MKIKVGEYGRTNEGKIFIFAWLENSDGARCEDKVVLIEDGHIANEFYYFEKGEHITKHSKHIID